MAPERFVGTNRKKKGHLIGASTPSGDTYMIAHVNPRAKGWFHEAYPAVARAAAMMETGIQVGVKVSKNDKISKPSKPSKPKKKKKGKDKPIQEEPRKTFVQSTSTSSTVLLQQQTQGDPYVKVEAENFLQWLRDPQGLANYINYYLTYNDFSMISQLANIYKRLYKMFY